MKLTAVVVAVALAALPFPAARADTPDAETLYQDGVTAYGAKDYGTAVARFKEAYARDARPDILFALAQAERLSGDCGSAIVHYRKFLDGKPPQVQADAAQQPLERCERSLESSPLAPPSPAPAPPLPAAVAPAPPTRAPRFYDDKYADLLVAGGVVVAGVGVALLATSGDPSRARTYDDFASAHDSASWHREVGVFAIGLGVALTAGGLVRWSIFHGNGDTGAAVAGTW